MTNNINVLSLNYCVGDTVCNLGIAMDELMRHQPTLKSSVIAGLIAVCHICHKESVASA